MRVLLTRFICKKTLYSLELLHFLLNYTCILLPVRKLARRYACGRVAPSAESIKRELYGD